MSSWFSFESGNKKDEIDDAKVIEDAIQLNDHQEKIMNQKGNVRKFLETISLATVKIDELLDATLNGLNDDVIDSVVDFFVDCKNGSNVEEEAGMICTAVVQCNFADVDGLEHRVAEKLRNGREPCIPIRVASTDTIIRNIIDAAESTKNGFIFVEQAECLSTEYVDRLFRLLQWSRIMVPVLVCVSTDISSFSSLCSLRTLNMLTAKSFRLASPSMVYVKIMTAIHQWDAGMCFSGEVLARIRGQFFGCDHSVAETKRTLRFAMLNHVLKHPLCFTQEEEYAEFRKYREYYWQVLEFLCTSLGENYSSPSKMFIVHEDIQNGTSLLDDTEVNRDEHQDYLTWRQGLTLHWVRNTFLPTLKEEERDKLSAALTNLEKTVEKQMHKLEVDQSKLPETPSSKKMSLHDLKRQQEAQRLKNMNDPVKTATKNVFTVVEKCLKSVLRPWSDDKCSEMFLITPDCMENLHSHPARDVEDALIYKEAENAPALSLAYRALLKRPKWNFVSLAEWGEQFETELPAALKPHAQAAFFASVGQLESIGIVKGGTEKQRGRVNVVYHPTNYAA